MEYQPGDNQLPGRSEASRTVYPLNAEDYMRLKRRCRWIVEVSITQVIVPELCDVDEVQISKHDLYTMPLVAAINSDPEADRLLKD